MKLIPCAHCGARNIGPKSDKYPNGMPVVFGRWTGGAGKIVVKCHRCTNSMKIGPVDFNRLPEAPAD